MSSSEAPGKPTEMQLKGPSYSIPLNSLPRMPCSAHLHRDTLLHRVSGAVEEDKEPYRCAAGQVWCRVLWAPREVPKLATLLVVCKSDIGPSVACSLTWHTKHVLFEMPVMLEGSA